MSRTHTVAVVQATPVLFDQAATLQKMAALVQEAKQGGAALVLFPEAFIPCYPRGLGFGMVVGSRTEAGRTLWQRYWEGAVSIPGPAMDAMSQMAQKHQVYLVVGIIERSETGGTLYCTMVYFGPDGSYLGKHRKLKPTGAERLIWGEGEGDSLQVYDTPLGKMGGLICWENYMPLARTALYQQGIQLYLAPTADARERWQSSMQHIALEGRCFVLSANQFVRKADYPTDLQAELSEHPEPFCRGGSVIYSPMGDVLAGPLWDQEGILFAELDPDLLIRSKLDFDPVGHYARPDVFEFRVKK
ncbi:MAG: carbon-nitrogen hydrolase family protein [Bacteroidota bacterium]